MNTAMQILCNGELVLFDVESFGRGELVKLPETLSEQCEDCGEDITHASVDLASVTCKCGANYHARVAVLA